MIVRGKKQQKKSIWVGLTNLTPVMFNPTAEDLSEIYGSEITREPNYVREDGTVNLRLVCKFNSPKGEQFVNLQIASLRNEEHVNQNSGNIRVITGKGQVFNGKSLEDISSNPKLSWADFSNARVARIGEADLYKILMLWASYDNRSEEDFVLDDEIWEAISGGDVEFLNNLINDEETGLKGYVIPLILTEKDGYQDWCPITPYSNGNVGGVTKTLARKHSEGYPYLGNCNWELKLGKVEVYDPLKHNTYHEHILATTSTEDSDDVTEEVVSGGWAA